MKCVLFLQLNKTILLIDVGYIGNKIYSNNSLIDLEDIGEGGAGIILEVVLMGIGYSPMDR